MDLHFCSNSFQLVKLVYEITEDGVGYAKRSQLMKGGRGSAKNVTDPNINCTVLDITKMRMRMCKV